MFRRILGPVIAGLLVGSVLPAHARDAGCPLITDPSGDAHGDAFFGSNRPDLDILAVNVKVVNGHFTTAVRVATLPEGSPLGAAYYVLLSRDGLEYSVQAFWDSTGMRFTVQTGSPADPTAPYRLTEVSGKLDYHRKEVRVEGPASALTPDGSTRAVRTLYDVGAETYNMYTGDTVYAGSAVDRAGGSATYRVGRQPCF